MNQCENCRNAIWDIVEYHSARECGLSGGNESFISDCKMIDKLPDNIFDDWLNNKDIKECPCQEEWDG